MRSYVQNAGSDGVFTVPAGYAFRLEPYDKAVFPLSVYPNGERGEKLEVHDDRVWPVGRFDRLEVEGAAPDSQWLVSLATRPEERLPESSGRYARPVRVFRSDLDSDRPLAAGGYRLDAGFAPSLGIYQGVVDVRRYRQFQLRLSYTMGDSPLAAGASGKLYLLDTDDFSLSNAYREYTLDLSPGLSGLLVWHFGEGVEEEETANAIHRAMRWNFISCRLEVGGLAEEERATFSGTFAELWGWP
jgi:hypothetical protein